MLSVIKDSEAASLTLRGLRLAFVPNSVLLKNELVSLILSGNELAEIPAGLGRLKNLQKLDVSENGLIEFPECVNKLTQLRELRLAHNNIQAVSIHAASHLNTVDIRWNAVSLLSASSLNAVQNLRVLHAEGNAVPDEQLAEVSALLSSRKRDAASLENKSSERNAIVRTKKPPVEENTTISSADANAEVTNQTADSGLNLLDEEGELLSSRQNKTTKVKLLLLNLCRRKPKQVKWQRLSTKHLRQWRTTKIKR